MGSVIVTPLYPLYERAFGFSELTLTLVYAAYAVGNVLALLVFGQVSDQIGRKPVALGGLGLAAVAAVLFVLADGTGWLFGARLCTGLAVGVLSGTGSAWLAERVGPERVGDAGLLAAAANLGGIALGPLLGGALAEAAPLPLRSPLVAYLVLVAVVVVVVLATPGGRGERSLREVRARPRIGVAREEVAPFTAPAVTAFVVFAVGGLYFALIPSIVGRDLRDPHPLTAGAVVFEFGAVAAAAVVVCRGLRPATAMRTGLLLLLPAVLLVAVAQAARSMPLLLAATAVGGGALALGYRGSLQTTNAIASDARRGELLSSYYLACFLGNSIPVVGVGLLGLVVAPLIGTVVLAAVLAALAVAALARSRTPA